MKFRGHGGSALVVLAVVVRVVTICLQLLYFRCFCHAADGEMIGDVGVDVESAEETNCGKYEERCRTRKIMKKYVL